MSTTVTESKREQKGAKKQEKQKNLTAWGN
jgi:hypothetical protein